MTLTIQDLGALGELLGAVAVLATLVYLALQTRQNTMAIKAQIDSARYASVQDLLLTEVTSTELQDALAEDRVHDLTINQARRSSYWAVHMHRLQRTMIDSRRLGVPNTTGVRNVRRLFSSYRSMEGWWEEEGRGRYLPEFVEWVEEQRSKAA